MGDLERQLQTLSNDTVAPNKARKRAATLFRRLTTPLRVAISGPDAETVTAVLRQLPNDPELLMTTDDIATADVAVWCTIFFATDEVAFWNAASPVLQDHSFLVGPQNAHIQDMGASFFREVCKADNVVEKLIQRVRMGREADADHAHALLQKHPPPLVVEFSDPVSQQDSPVLQFLQAQATKLAALEISDTVDSCDAVLTLCCETAHGLTERITSEPDKELQNVVYDASDAITLMMIEGDIGAAADAVTTLINLKEQFGNQTKATRVS